MVRYILFIIFMLFLAVIYKKYDLKNKLNDKASEYDLIQKYFFNKNDDFPEISKDKNIIWIYIENEKDSKKAHCPYILWCIESIINNSGNDFKIILIDTDSFKRLLPDWDINFDIISNPIKENFINLGILKILYKYGGIKLPNSCILLKNLSKIYNYSLSENDSFCVEENNKSLYNEFENYVPGLNIYGCKKNSEVINNLIKYYENIILKDNTNNFKITGQIHKKLDFYCKNKKMNLVNGKFFGIKDEDNTPVNVDRLMSSKYINFTKKMVLLYIPNDDLKKINKYNWITKISQTDLRQCNNIICKYFILGGC